MENIPVFLILALCILSASFLPTWIYFLQGNVASTPTDTTAQYVWISGSQGFDEGLYLLTPEQLEKNFPELLPIVRETALSSRSDFWVSAIQYMSGLPKSIDLPPAVANIFFQPIPINYAKKEILVTLPGIGPVLAEKIMRRITDKGPFKSKEELLDINGIGPKKLARLADSITLNQ